jgi:hypothetical protein
MANNFEKFKEGLTIDTLINLLDSNCVICPCRRKCNNDVSGCTCHEFLQKWLETSENDREQVVLRANILGGLNSYILDLGDESIIEPWLMCGVPDGCTEEELMEIAEDVDDFRSIVKEFAKLI